MKKLFSIIFLFLVFTSAAFAEPSFTQLQLRELQTRFYETTDTGQVTKAVINTLQDNGFVIQNIEDELGYITAKKEFRAKRTDKRRVAIYSAEYAYYGTLTALSWGAAAPYLIYPSLHMKNELSKHPVIVSCNVTIEPYGKQTKVRFTFIERIFENADGYMFIKSSPRKVVRYYKPEIYQEFFKQLDKNLFIENI